MPTLPVGTVTFLLTDIEGSTHLVQQLGADFRGVIDRHHAILREAISTNHGIEVSTEGDAFFAAFESATEAVKATIAAQRALAAARWPDGMTVAVRMGLHTGDGVLGGDNYMGIDVHRAARICAAGHGGQVLLSASTTALVSGSLPGDVGLRDLGRHRLKDLPDPEHVSQLVIDGLRDTFPALRAIEGSRTNLNPPATPLVGRDRELEELSSLLATTRLLTLTGPGGTGKTRLATELGTRRSGTFVDGVFFVPLETFAERSPAAGEIGRTVGARLPGERDPEDNLSEHLADLELLLLLDNLEQLADAGPLVARMLVGAPRLRVVATSRVPLHVSGEQEYPVAPLAVPDATDGASLDDLARVDSVALFVERARRVKPDFRLTETNAPAVAAIARRLDGLPLAIELAAARIKLFSPAALLTRLDRALPMLGGGSVDLPARQRTLRAAIEWSCALLGAPEQRLFRQLTVFSGGWTVEAAETVLTPDEIGLDILDGLSALLDHSLIRTVADEGSGETRFDMLQLIREYGAERLAESNEADSAGRRHAEWVLGQVEQAAAALESDADPAWLDRMTREHDNLRAALRWSLSSGQRELGLRIASAAWRFWQQRGHTGEGREWLRRLMADATDVSPAVVAAAHTAAGGLAYWQDDLAAAESHYQAAYELDSSLGIADRLGNDVYNLGFISMFQRDLEGARRRFDESAELFKAAGQTKRLADTTLVRGAVEMRAGHLEEARKWTTEGRRLQLEQGNRSRGTDGAMVLSFISLGLDDLVAARNWIETAMRETTAAGYVVRWPLIYEVGIGLALKRGRPLDALRLAAGAAHLRQKLGGSAPTFFSDVDKLVSEARTAVAETGDPGAADAAWAEGEQLDQEALVALITT